MTDNIFGNLTSQGLTETEDRLGGFSVLDTDLYDGIIKLAYAGKSTTSNAQSITFHLDIGSGREHRETIWITSGEGNNFYVDKKDPTKKHPLPGFVTIDDLCLLSTGFPLSGQTTEEKTVMIYDFEQRKEIPKNVYVITSILGKPITAGIQRIIEDKTKKNDQTGKYEPTGETREINQVDKFFHTDTKKTTVELRNNKENAQFYSEWNKKYTNDDGTKKVINKSKGAAGKAGNPAQRPQAGQGAAQGTTATSLFNKG